MMTMENSDWRYTPERMKLRQECLSILMLKYGDVQIDQAPYSTQDIYECAHDWVSQGNQISHGIVAYFKAYFINGKK